MVKKNRSRKSLQFKLNTCKRYFRISVPTILLKFILDHVSLTKHRKLLHLNLEHNFINNYGFGKKNLLALVFHISLTTHLFYSVNLLSAAC